MNDIEIANLFRICCNRNMPSDRLTIQRSINSLIENPEYHHLAPLVVKNLGNKQLEQYKASLTLKKISIQVIANYLEKRNFVKKLSKELEYRGLKLILLKSMAFNDNIYKADSPRGSSDIDILVNDKDINEILKILKSFNFVRSQKDDKPFTDSYESTWYSGGIYIDLHRFLVNPFKFFIDTKTLFKYSIPHAYYNSENIRILSIEDNLNHLALHFQNDCYAYHHSLIDNEHLIVKNENKKIKNPEEFRRINNIFKFFADIILYDKTPSPLAKIFFYVTPKKRIYSNGLRRKTIQIVFDILSFQSCKDLIIYYCSYLKQLVIKNKWNDIDR